MKKSFSVKNREKFQKKQRSFKQEAKAFCFFNSAKICVLNFLEYNKDITKTRKAKSKRSCRGSNPRFSFHGVKPLLHIRPFFVWQDRQPDWLAVLLSQWRVHPTDNLTRKSKQYASELAAVLRAIVIISVRKKTGILQRILPVLQKLHMPLGVHLDSLNAIWTP